MSRMRAKKSQPFSVGICVVAASIEQHERIRMVAGIVEKLLHSYPQSYPHALLGGVAMDTAGSPRRGFVQQIGGSGPKRCNRAAEDRMPGRLPRQYQGTWSTADITHNDLALSDPATPLAVEGVT